MRRTVVLGLQARTRARALVKSMPSGSRDAAWHSERLFGFPVLVVVECGARSPIQQFPVHNEGRTIVRYNATLSICASLLAFLVVPLGGPTRQRDASMKTFGLRFGGLV